MARPKATPEQREEVRRGIQQAAAELYRSEGIAAISARSVARKAGVSVGTIYTHFSDLTALMQSLWTGRVERQNAKFRALAQQYADPSERLKALMTAYLSFGVDNVDLYRGVFLFVRPESHETPDAEPLQSYAFPALLIEAVHEGQSSGQFVDAPPETLVQILWSGLHGCLALPINLDRVAFMPAAEMAEGTIKALVRAIAASGD
ncbi:MAG: TetR/AcrR family transcriptional regulator [Pseudomonadota bacterium]